jgi:hypothetical protein
MNGKLTWILAICISIFFAGCVPKQTYYFGNYSKTLYALEKYQNEETLIRHKQELEKIISESQVQNLAVPPGIYAELGYIYLKENKSKEAVTLFETESQLYPESKHLMDRLIQSAKAKESSDTNVSNISTTATDNSDSK